MDITTLISDMGLPVACMVAMGYFVLMLFNTNRADTRELTGLYRSDIDKLIVNNEKLATALNTASETQKLLFDRVDKIETKVDDIDNKLDKVIN